MESTSAFVSEREIFPFDLVIANFYIGQNFFAKFAGLAVDLCHWLAVDLEAVETVDSRIFKSQSYRVSAFFAVSGIAEEIMLATVCIVLICKNLDRFLEETSSDLDRSFLTLLPVTPVAVFFQQFVLLVSCHFGPFFVADHFSWGKPFVIQAFRDQICLRIFLSFKDQLELCIFLCDHDFAILEAAAFASDV